MEVRGAIGWMIAASIASALVVAAFVDRASARAVVAGMAGPVVSACVTWVMIDRTLRTRPTAMTGRLIRGFFVKAVVFLCYVFVAVRMFGLPARPFAMSFAAYFIVLHQTEAFLLRQRVDRASRLS